MGRPRFTVLTPVHVWNQYRIDGLKAAGESLEKQTFKDFEWLVVNDGSTVEFTVPKWARVINKEHAERVVAYNAGLKKAKGEIICFLDSDDEYEPDYLEKVDSYFRRWPSYKIFNFGARYINPDGSEAVRNAFRLRKKRVGHVPFGGGKIVNGTFVFHRDVYEDLGAFPPTNIYSIDCSSLNYGTSYGAPPIRDLFMGTPFDFSAMAQLEFPEIQKYFFVNHVDEPKKVIKELGNPWGNDYYLFYKYTRKYHSKWIDDHNYIVHSKVGVM
jgi:glycosyltransferase involved in cell wall biosynthesis